MSGIRVGGVWRTPAQTFVKVAGVWKNVATLSVKVGGTWRTSTFAQAPAAPIMTYLGSGTSNNGLFEVNNTVAGAQYVATIVSGGGSATQSVVNGKVRFQLTSSPSRWSVKARWAAGAPESAADFMERKPAVLINVPFTQYVNPCGDCTDAPGYWTWTCGCVGADAGGGQWGACICRGPGYSYYENQPGYNWSGNDYTNGQGEWWKVT